jgi:hypothetical protein
MVVDIKRVFFYNSYQLRIKKYGIYGTTSSGRNQKQEKYS